MRIIENPYCVFVCNNNVDEITLDALSTPNFEVLLIFLGEKKLESIKTWENDDCTSHVTLEVLLLLLYFLNVKFDAQCILVISL